MQYSQDGFHSYLRLLAPRVLCRIREYGVRPASHLSGCSLESVTTAVFQVKSALNQPWNVQETTLLAQGIRTLAPIVEQVAEQRIQEKAREMYQRFAGENPHVGVQVSMTEGQRSHGDEATANLKELSLEERRERESRVYTFRICVLSGIQEEKRGIIEDARTYVVEHWRKGVTCPEHKTCDQILAWSTPLMRMSALLSLPEYSENHEDAKGVVDQALLGLGNALYGHLLLSSSDLNDGSGSEGS